MPGYGQAVARGSGARGQTNVSMGERGKKPAPSEQSFQCGQARSIRSLEIFFRPRACKQPNSEKFSCDAGVVGLGAQ